MTSSGLIENPPFPPPVTNLVVMTVNGVWHADATWQNSPTSLTAACIADATFVSRVVAPTSFGAGSVSATAISPLYAEIVVPNVIQGSHFVAVTGGAAEQVIGETTATSNTLSIRVPLGSGEVWILGQGLWLSEFPAPMEWVTVVPDGPGASHDFPVYRGVVPARVLESRVGSGLSTVDGLFVGSGALGPDASRVLQISGRAGIPVGFVGTVALNVTVTNASEASYLTVYPAGAVVPETSNLHFLAGETVPNMVLVPTSSDGRVALYNRFGSVDTIIDVLGYFAESGGFTGVVPARVLESRVGSGLSTVDGLFVGSGALGPDASRVVQISGRAGIPVGFVGTVALNVTVTNASEASYLTVYPAGAVVPETSNLNFLAGQTVPNMVLVPTSSDGRVALYNRFGSVDTIIDVLGYFPGS